MYDPSVPSVPSTWAVPPASERLRVAWQGRHESDYIFDFATALGWTLLTCGVYGIYVFYQLVRRSRDHNRRRLSLLDAATEFAWQQAQAKGLSEQLRPNFEQISVRTRELGALAAEFRDPILWVVLSLVSGGIAQYVAYILIDGDLVKHEAAERAIETELATIYAQLGRAISPPELGPPKGRHNAAGRIIATLASCGFYALWWLRDLMVEGNAHFERNWRFEDELAHASQALLAG
jgi:hypothetical protein